MTSKVENPNSPAIPSGWTPLHVAAQFGNIKVIRHLASKEKNPNGPNPNNGMTPICLAARYEPSHIRYIQTYFLIHFYYLRNKYFLA